jgi:hypothetical protein
MRWAALRFFESREAQPIVRKSQWSYLKGSVTVVLAELLNEHLALWIKRG